MLVASPWPEVPQSVASPPVRSPSPSRKPSVVRPGRCLAQIEIGRLSHAEAAAWLGTADGAPDGATLAELYALRDGRPVETERRAAGTGFYL